MQWGRHGGKRAGSRLGLWAADLTVWGLSICVVACEAGDATFARGSLGAARQPLGDAGASAPAGDAAVTPDAAASAASNGCCSTSSTGGCSDVAVQACVCAGDDFCCSTEYDGACVTQAQSRCGLDCDERAPESSCCAPSGVPGCTQPDVQACICDIDPFCCVFRFDRNCVNLATARCGAACGDAGTAP